jgi:hypothetical protein
LTQNIFVLLQDFLTARGRVWRLIKSACKSQWIDGCGETDFPVKQEDYIGGEPSEFPKPEWYVEHFRSHISTIHELFKGCPSQQWTTLSLAIGGALAEVGEKFGLKIEFRGQTEDKEP